MKRRESVLSNFVILVVYGNRKCFRKWFILGQKIKRLMKDCWLSNNVQYPCIPLSSWYIWSKDTVTNPYNREHINHTSGNVSQLSKVTRNNFFFFWHINDKNLTPSEPSCLPYSPQLVHFCAVASSKWSMDFHLRSKVKLPLPSSSLKYVLQKYGFGSDYGSRINRSVESLLDN